MPENIQDVALAIVLVFPILRTLVVGLRCWSRLLGRQFGWDDGFIVVAWILAIGQTYTVWMYTKLTYSRYHSIDKYNLANQLLYNPILAIVKASVIVFLDRRRIVRWNLHALSAVNLGLLLSIFLSDLFQCKAARADTKARTETGLVKGRQCINQIAFFLGSAGFTIVTNIWLLCIPAIIVWRLQMSKRKKTAIIGILSMGIIVTALSIARLVIYAQRFSPHSKDRTCNIGHTVSGTEANLAIITASATALNSLVARFAPRFWRSSAHHSTSQQGPSGWRERSTAAGGSRTRDIYPLRDSSRRQKGPSDSQEEIMPFGLRSNAPPHFSAASSGAPHS
ncbi:uncharacterized protein BDW43DRAFT_321363 [Aspergillus alliaceus]|uniref:uncharacterized protein n=1 Tax=Petromyces alliaceus TaxID=209559 RepID=UPI0012A631B2|nr:uncharacterized protein BDW43DRAFT_321363 [Aspergillus alliaceus]KAB8230759.1 hypothetical protein BDW43DRAFT_321363 [Aspergillus alliaceus]